MNIRYLPDELKVLAALTLAAVIGAGSFLFLIATKPAPKHPPIRTDPETGCQYVLEGPSGITPRLDRFGVPMCGNAAPRPATVS